jgi:hypothetical protein
MATKDKENALAKNAAGTTALAGAYDYGTDANAGWENTGADDFTVPFLSVLQAGSPQCKKKNAKHVEGAEEGMLYNTATGDIYGAEEGVQIIPCYTEHIYIEWKNKQKDGGGFVGTHNPDSDLVLRAREASTQFGKYIVPVPDGIDHDLVETFVIYCLLLDAAGELIGPCMLSMASTKIKAYKAIMSPLRAVKGRPPLFAFKLKVTTVFVPNAKGDYHNFKIVPANGSPVDSLIAPDDVLFLAGKEFKELVAAGKAKIDHGKANAASGSGGGDVKDAPF